MLDYRKLEISEVDRVFKTQCGTGFKWIGKINNYFLFAYGESFKLLIEDNGVCILEQDGKEIPIVNERAKDVIDYYWNIKEWSGEWKRRIIL